MEIELKFLFTILLLYMCFNVYTDFRWQVTKNKWHLGFLTGIIFYSIYQNTVFDVCIMLIVGLLIGYLLGKIPNSFFGAGDIKMLAVISVLFGSMYGVLSEQYLLFLLIYLIADFSILNVMRGIQKKMKKNDLRYGSYKITKKIVEMPEAIPLTLASLLSPIILK